MNDQETSLERFIALVRQETGADDVRIVEGEVDPGTLGRGFTVWAPMGRQGRRIVVTLAAQPIDRDAVLRRVELLVASFEDTVGQTSPSGRPPAAMQLHDELEALVKRSSAADALVIDGHSPIVWGATQDDLVLRPSYEPDVIPLPERERPVTLPFGHLHLAGSRADVVPLTVPAAPPRAAGDDSLAQRAISAVRALPELGTLHRGGHLRQSLRDDDFGFIARSFASIYVLILVFDRPYDELAAERALVLALPAIERLVLALPPLDPAPHTGRAAIRRPRKR